MFRHGEEEKMFIKFPAMTKLASLPIFLLSLFLPFAQGKAQTIDWVNLPGSTKSDVAEDIVVDAAGYSYVTGKFSTTFNIGDTTLVSAGREDIFIAKFDPDGDLLWARRAGGVLEDQGIEIDIDAAGNVYTVGRFEATATFGPMTIASQGNVDIFVIKYDADGNFVWVNPLGGSRDDRCRGLSVTPEGFCYIGGRYRVSTKLNGIILTAIEEEDVFVAKLDTTGQVLWAQTFGGIRKDFGEDVIADSEGNVYITGSFFQFIIFPDTTYYGLGDEEIFLAKYDTDGNYVWSRYFGGSLRDYGEALDVDEFDNVLVSGTFSGEGYFGKDTLQSRGEMDMFLIKVNPDGEVLWAFGAGAPINNDVAWAISYDGRGNSILSGWFKGLMTFGDTTLFGSNSFNIFAGKVSGAGKAIWASKLGNTNSEDIGRGVSTDAAGNVYVAGGYEGTATYGSVTATAVGGYDIIHAKLFAGPDECAISHAYAGLPTECTPTDTLYDIALTLYHYFAPTTGSLSVNGQLFPIGGNEQVVTLVDQLPIGGFKDLHAFFTDNPACSLKVSNAYLTPASCDPCLVSGISVVNVGTCKVATNRYTARLAISYSKAPESGFLVVNGQQLPVTSSPQIVDLVNLYSDGQPVAIDVHFTEDPFCGFSTDSLFTAPLACSSCRVSGAVVNSVGTCDPVSNTYIAEIGLGFRAWPPTGGVFVNGQLFDITTPPMTITLEGLLPDGLPEDLQVTFEGDSLCGDTLANVFTAPPPCDSCIITGVTFGNYGRCNPLDLTYSAELLLTYSNQPDTGSLSINGQLFPILGSPQPFLLEDLALDGLPVNISAFFTDQSSCVFAESAVFNAPDTCQDCLITGISLSDLLDNCDPFTNRYEVELQIDYLNPPAGGNLLVSGQAFPIGSSPQTVVLTGLAADAQPEDFTAFFANDVVCAFSVADLYNAPAPCDTCALPRNLVSTLNPLLPSEALIEWDPVPDAVSYTVRGRRMPTGGYGYINPNGPGRVVKNLNPGQTYGWSVQSNCPYDTSEFSPEVYFTLFTARMVDSEGTLGDKLSLFPNPSTGPTHVLVQSTTSQPIQVRVLNLQGAVLQQISREGDVGATAIPLDLSSFAPGMYLVEVTQASESGVLHIQISR